MVVDDGSWLVKSLLNDGGLSHLERGCTDGAAGNDLAEVSPAVSGNMAIFALWCLCICTGHSFLLELFLFVSMSLWCTG